MRRPLVFGLLAALIVLPAPAQAAEHEYHRCPAEARGTVSHNGATDWLATNQSSRPTNALVSDIGGQPALVCVYRMFGSDYWIYKRPSAQFARCSVRSDTEARFAFYCLR